MDENRQVPPAIMLRQLSYVMRASRALYAAAEFGLADILAAGPMTSEEIGAKAGADGPTMRRLMRTLVAHGIFEEPEFDCFRLNTVGELLRRGVPGSQRAGVLFTAGKTRWELWSDFLECVRTGQASVERAFGKTIFERNAESPEESALFSEAMASYSAALSAPLMAAYDFGAFRRLADIGGGTGRLIADVLVANTEMRGILFDLPHVVAGAPPLLAASGVEARCEVVGGSFFDRAPSGAEVYIMRAVLHDWDDERSIAILKNVRKAMTKDAVLLVVERVLPEKAEAGTAVDSYLLDLEMLVNTPGGRERSESEFGEILKAAGFATPRLVQTTTAISIVEARPT